MVTITEEPVSPPAKSSRERAISSQGDRSKPVSQLNATHEYLKSPSSRSQYVFWLNIFGVGVVLALVLVTLSSYGDFHKPQSLSFFLSLPSSVKDYYSKGRVIKIHINQGDPPIEVFTFESENYSDEIREKVLIVHGMGLCSFGFREIVSYLGAKGVHGVAFDLPGHGFSQKFVKKVENWEERGISDKIRDIYRLIKEKGVFWAFDMMIETGRLPHEEIELHLRKEKIVQVPAELGSEEMGMVLGQVINSLELAPVHLVLHDSSIAMVGDWVSENPNLIRSVSLVDASPAPAFPLWLMESPPIFLLTKGTNAVYNSLIHFCCGRGISKSDLLAHRLMFRAGSAAMMAMNKKLNRSFELREWSESGGIKGAPLQVIWSRNWSKRWNSTRDAVTKALPRARFASHSGCRWPNEQSSEEIADHLYNFVSSLPKSERARKRHYPKEHIEMEDGSSSYGNSYPGYSGFMNSYGHDDEWGI